MFQIRSLSIIFLTLFCGALCRGTESCGIEVTPFGFAAADLFFDTRQGVAPRDKYVFLWPLPVKPDPQGADINAHGEWGLTPVQTRLGLQALWNWRAGTLKGYIEGDFLGIADPFVGTFRLRQAYAEIATPQWSLIVGQTWQPMFVLDCFPDTISFANGAPMETLAREPQVRFTAKGAKKEFIVAAMVARDYPTIGPIGTTGDLIRNAVIPEIHAQARFFPSEDTVIGVALDYKRLAPRIESTEGFAVHESIDSLMWEWYAAYNSKKFQWRMKFIYDQNGADLLLLSGFAVKSINPLTGKQTYANTQAMSGWLDTAYWFHHESVSVGAFLGYTKMLGSRNPLYIDKVTKQPIVFALDPTLDYVGRFAPRCKYKQELFQCGLELEFTWAAYGTLNNRAQVIHPVPVHNVRLMLEALYFF